MVRVWREGGGSNGAGRVSTPEPRPDGLGSVAFVAVHPVTESQGESEHTVRKCGGGIDERHRGQEKERSYFFAGSIFSITMAFRPSRSMTVPVTVTSCST